MIRKAFKVAREATRGAIVGAGVAMLREWVPDDEIEAIDHMVAEHLAKTMPEIAGLLRDRPSLPLCEDGDCPDWGHGYMLTDEVWNEAVSASDDVRFLCVTHVEQRLERRLRYEDFPDVPINMAVRSVYGRIDE